MRPALEIADLLRRHGPAWRVARTGRVGLDQRNVMSAIETCRTAAMGATSKNAKTAAIGALPTMAAATAIAPRAKDVSPDLPGEVVRDWRHKADPPLLKPLPDGPSGEQGMEFVAIPDPRQIQSTVLAERFYGGLGAGIGVTLPAESRDQHLPVRLIQQVSWPTLRQLWRQRHAVDGNGAIQAIRAKS